MSAAAVALATQGRVIVTGERSGSAVCSVEWVEPVANLAGITRIARLSYPAGVNLENVFTVLEIGGEWFDVQGQRLELEPYVSA